MDTKQARTLQAGQRVFFQSDAKVPQPGDFGTVMAKDYASILVKWDDGLEIAYRIVRCDSIHKVGYMDVTDPRVARFG
jgi:hypothetical protein